VNSGASEGSAVPDTNQTFVGQIKISPDLKKILNQHKKKNL
jgi:hypothetical protein